MIYHEAIEWYTKSLSNSVKYSNYVKSDASEPLPVHLPPVDSHVCFREFSEGPLFSGVDSLTRHVRFPTPSCFDLDEDEGILFRCDDIDLTSVVTPIYIKD